MYINFKQGPIKEEDTQLFIATQGPITVTIENFWKMIIVKRSKLIIMLTNLKENGRVIFHFIQSKCDQYWPINKDSPLIYQNFKIIFESEEEILENAIINRNFTIEFNDIRISITHLQIICWPDHNIPEQEIGYKSIELISSYIDDFRLNDFVSPIVIHCRY